MVRLRIHLAVTICLIVGLGAMAGMPWQGTAQLHTAIEGVATSLSFTIGALALVRYYSKKRDLYLFVGAGFVATGLLDGYHTVISSEWLMGSLPASQPELVPWSWLPSRILLAGFLLAGTWSWQNHANSSVRREWAIYVASAAVAIATFLIFALAPLPRSVFPDLYFTRPQETVPGILFLLALISCHRNGRWRSDDFEHWLVISLIIAVATQTMIMPMSASLFDRQFDTGHLLKLISYVCVLVGLLVSTYKIFAQAEENAEHVATIVRTAADAIVTFDKDGRVGSFNPAAERIFGYGESEAMGMRVRDLITDYIDTGKSNADNERFKNDILARIGLAGDRTGVRKDGSRFPLSLSVSRMVHGPREMFNGIIRDVTREKESAHRLAILLQKLTRANEELETFAYITSHDLRAPLRGIDNLVSWIESDDDNRISKESLHNMQRLRLRVGRFERLLDGLQQFTQAGRNAAQTETLNCTELVESVVDSIALPKEFSVQLNDSAGEFQGSRVALETILRNLISNAVKHHDKKSGQISINVVDNGDYVTFEVSDNGPGIKPAHHKKIFNIFQTLASKSQGEGSGVGLAIVQRLVEAADASIIVRSPLHDGRGTAFVFDWSKGEREHWSSF